MQIGDIVKITRKITRKSLGETVTIDSGTDGYVDDIDGNRLLLEFDGYAFWVSKECVKTSQLEKQDN